MSEAFIIYLYLYLTLGIVQVLSAIISRVFRTIQSLEYKRRLDRYLIAVAVYFVIMFLGTGLLKNTESFRHILKIYVAILPWALAIYKWRIRVYKLKPQKTVTDISSR